MSNENRVEIYQRVEAESSPLALDSGREQIFRGAAHAFALEGDSESARYLLAESLVFGAHQCETDESRVFLEPIAFLDGFRVGDPMMVPVELIPYFESRLHETTSPYMRARYGDFLWQKGGSHEHARAAVAAHKELVTLEAARHRYHDASDSARRALRLSYSLGGRNLRELTEDELTNACHDWAESEDGALFLPEVAMCIAGSSRPRWELLGQWIVLLQEGLANSGEHRTRRDLLEALGTLFEKTGDNELARAAKSAIGDEWVAEAEERKETSALVAAKFYESAFEAYAAAGESEKAEEVKKLVRSVYLAAESEFGAISHQVTLDMKPWRDQVAKWTNLSADEALTELAKTFWLMPDWEEAGQSSSDLNTSAPLSQLIPMVTLDEGRPVAQPRGPEQQAEGNVRRQYHLQMPLRSVYLSSGLSALREGMELSADDFVRVLSASPFFDGRDLGIERTGFERYLDGDLVSAIHTLTPRIEEAIRRQAAALGANTTGMRQGVMTEKSLDQLLEDPTVQAFLDMLPRLRRYLYELLIEQSGPNLRNKVAHGIISLEDCNQENADRVVHLYLLLSLFKPVEK